MGDIFKKVRTGDPLVIPAGAYNAFIDAAEDCRHRQRNYLQEARAAVRQDGVVLVKNNSGADRQRFEVLGIDGPLYSPTDNPDAFKNTVVLKGIIPTEAAHQGRFVVLLEPVAAGALGRAKISGVCPAQIYIVSEGHACADVENNQPARLRSCNAGAAAILWKESGTGVKWAIVRWGTAGSLAVYGWYSNHAAAGQYNCRLQSWVNGAWTQASSTTVVGKVTKETSGHAFGSGDLFLALGPADANGVIPVLPLFYAYAK